MNTRKALEKTKAKQIKKEIKDQKKKKEWWIIKTKKYRIPLYFLPLAIFLIPIYEIRDLCKNKIRRDFTDENCKKVLDKVVPKMLKWSEKDDLPDCVERERRSCRAGRNLDGNPRGYASLYQIG